MSCGSSSPVGVEARSPCSCSGSRRRASKLTWCLAGVIGHGESLQNFVVDPFDDESNRSSGCVSGACRLRNSHERATGSVVSCSAS